MDNLRAVVLKIIDLNDRIIKSCSGAASPAVLAEVLGEQKNIIEQLRIIVADMATRSAGRKKSE